MDSARRRTGLDYWHGDDQLRRPRADDAGPLEPRNRWYWTRATQAQSLSRAVLKAYGRTAAAGPVSRAQAQRKSRPPLPTSVGAPSRIPLQPESEISLGQRTVGHCYKRDDLIGLRRFEFSSVQIWKRASHQERGTLVSVIEGMVLRNPHAQRGAHSRAAAVLRCCFRLPSLRKQAQCE